MGKIVVLDDLTINKIAAGEVIERPASVVKEMVENSIDAGAKNITIEIKNGGISLIKITDDGSGIEEDDMEISFERHATSKIRKAEDLMNVKSMGFRGEALASVAAIANVEMISKTENSNIGHKIVIEGGKVLEKSEIGCQKGTTITVRNLFFNTPVRYKFLKRDFTEAGYIEDVVTRIALVNKNVAIKLINSGKTVIQTNGNGDYKNIIYSIYGKDIANGTIDINYDYEDMKITGVVGKPEIARANRSYQIFFVNGRYIKDKNLTAATEQAYKGMIPIGKYGVVMLNIDMDPSKVDVNVHPAKLEVRFEEENKVFKAIYHAIKSGLGNSELVANVEENEKNEENNEIKENSKINEIVELDTQKEVENNKNGMVKLLEKFKKEKEETKEELENNHLREIYEFRNGLKQIGIQPELKIQSDEEILNNIIKEKEETKQTKIENTVISSTTKPINENVDEELKNSIVSDMTIKKEKKIDNIDASKILQSEDVSSAILKDRFNSNNTQIIDTAEVRKAIENNTSSNSDFQTMYKKTFGVELAEVRKMKEEEKEKIDISKDFEYPKVENINVFEKEETYVPEKQYKFIGIVFSTYIIIEIKDEMYIIDQHAAHERIMYEKVKANYYSDSNKDSQILLLPDIVTLTNKEMAIAKENIEMFRKAGFDFEEFGENTIKLTEVPSMCEKLNTKQLFLDILDEIDSVAVTATQEKEDKFIATIACKSAVKAKMKLDEKEVDNLMNQLLKLPNPFSCPHGRPTAIKMSKNDIERKFSRR
ncbi:MAG: DNA mismatch repair endonuclease MutL [Candidatus Scatovivens sp.]